MSQRAAIAGIDVEDQVGNVGKAVPLGRWGEPSDIANMVAYLAGPKAEWMTGEVVRVSGGMEGVGSAPPKRAAKL
jgi:3-oxoacyl-[acyl-carrier protein] reductase